MWPAIIQQGMVWKMSEFERFHPIINFTYFVFVICFSCLLMHPIALLISFFGGFMYSVLLKGAKQMKQNLCFALPAFFAAVIINPAFNHEGVTILAYLPSGNPLTLESVVYGIAAAIMIVSVMLIFVCLNEVMTSDKIIYLFGKIIPSLALIFSMTLRFVPLFIRNIKATAKTQKCIGRDVSGEGFIKRVSSAVSIFSIIVTRSLENAVDTADSMRARGYGSTRRTAFSIFSFTSRDVKALVLMLVLGVYVIIGFAFGKVKVSYFPDLQFAEINLYNISVFCAYFVLIFLPIIIELTEVRKWRLSR